MSLELWLVYLTAAVGLSLTPGPNGLLSLTLGASLGLKRAAFAVLGGAMGFLVLIAASLAGLGALLATSEIAFSIAKWLGAAYLIYLGIRLWRSPPPRVDTGEADGPSATASPFRLAAQGFLVAVSNPKGLIFFAAFLPQFMTPGATFLMNLLWLGGTFVVVEILYELLVAGFAQRLAPWLGRNGRWFNRVTGGAFVGVGAALSTANR